MRPPRVRPLVFVGSTDKFIAECVGKSLNDVADVDVWPLNVFKAGYSNLENLLERTLKMDFAVLVFTPDDLVEGQGWAPRDNVVFESGLFMSRLPQGRTFILCAQGERSPKIPTDLSGISLVFFQNRAERIEEQVAHACFEIKKRIKELGLNESAANEVLTTRDQLVTPGLKLRWSDLEARCQQEIVIAGWSCRNVISGKTRDVFKRLAERDRDVRFLILDPEVVTDTKFDMGPVCNIDHSHILKDVKSGIEQVEELRSHVAAKNRDKIELRGTGWFMAWSAIGIDVEFESGIVQVELYHYANPYEIAEHLDRRVELILEPRSKFYQGFAGSLLNIWKAARRLIP